jgi:hypothetical protein
LKIAEDNGSGIITGISVTDTYDPFEEYLVSGTVDYDTSTISFTISNIINNPVVYGLLNPGASLDDGFRLQIRYKTRNGNGDLSNDVRLPYFYQIIDYADEDTNFTFNYDV